MLRTDRPNIFPINDPIGAVVWGMDTSNVDSVFVAGKALKRNGQLLGVGLNNVRKMAYDSRDYVVSQSGFKLPEILACDDRKSQNSIVASEIHCYFVVLSVSLDRH